MSLINQNKFQNQMDLSDIYYDAKHNLDLGRYVKRPKISMNTEYGKRFLTPQRNVSFAHQFEDNLEKPETVAPFKTEYNTNYQNSNAKKQFTIKNIVKQKNEAPFQRSTTYNSNFIGHRGMNQYVRVKKESVRESLRFRAKTTYEDTYIPNKQTRARQVPFYFNSSLKSESKINQKIHKQTHKSISNMNFGKKQASENPESFRYDYSTTMLFSTPVKKSVGFQTSYGSDFKSLIVERPKISPSINYKKEQFKAYRQLEIKQLKRKIQTCI